MPLQNLNAPDLLAEWDNKIFKNTTDNLYDTTDDEKSDPSYYPTIAEQKADDLQPKILVISTLLQNPTPCN